MTRRVRFSNEAIDDLEATEAYIARDKPGAAAVTIENTILLYDSW